MEVQVALLTLDLLLGFLVGDLGHVHQLIVAAERTATNQHIGRIDQRRTGILFLVLSGLLVISCQPCVQILKLQNLHIGGFSLAQGHIFDNFHIAVFVLLIGVHLHITVGTHQIEHIGAGVGIKFAIVHIHQAAFVLAVVQGLDVGVLIVQTLHFDDRVADIFGRTVTDEVTAVDHQRTAGTDLGNSTLNTGSCTAVGIVLDEVVNALTQIKSTVYHAHDLVLVQSRGGNGLVELSGLGVQLALGRLLLVGLVVLALIALGGLAILGVVLLGLLGGNGFVLLLGFVAATGGGRGLLLGILGGLVVLAVLLSGVTGIRAGITALAGLLLVLIVAIQEVLLRSISGINAGGVFHDAGAENHGLTDDFLQRIHGEAVLILIILTAGLEFAAVDHQLTAAGDMENVTVGVVVQVPFLMVDHHGVGIDAAGGIRGADGAHLTGGTVSHGVCLATGVDDSQGGTVGDAEHIGMVVFHRGGLVIGLRCPAMGIHLVPLVIQLDGVAVQIQHLVGLDNDDLVVIMAGGTLYILHQHDVLVILVGRLQIVTQIAAGALVVSVEDLAPLVGVFVAVVVVLADSLGGHVVLTFTGHLVKGCCIGVVGMEINVQIPLFIDLILFCLCHGTGYGNGEVDDPGRDHAKHHHQRQRQAKHALNQ